MKSSLVFVLSMALSSLAMANTSLKREGCDSIWKNSMSDSQIYFSTLAAKAANASVAAKINSLLANSKESYPRASVCIKGELVMKSGSATEVQYLLIEDVSAAAE